MEARRLSPPLAALALLAPTAIAAPVQESAEEQYLFVAGLYEKGLYDLVVKEGRAFLREHPRHARAALARYRVASALFELDRFAEAAPELERLAGVRDFEFAAECWFRLGQCRAAAGDPDGAAQAFEAVLRGGTAYLAAPATFLLGEAEFQRGRYEAADERYRAILADRSEGAREYAAEAAYGSAWCAFHLGRHDQCVERVERFLREHPGDEAADELRFLAGEAHLEAGRPKRALAAYESVHAGPHAPAALRGRAFAYAALEDHEQAARAFGELLERYPDSPFAPEAALHRGIHLLKAGDAAGAVRALDHAAAPKGAELLYWQAVARREAGDAAAAVKLLERALRERPDDELRGRIEIARGDALYALGRGDEAAAAYARADSDYALHAAAIASLNGGEPAEAIRLGRQLVEHFPESAYVPFARLAIGMGLFEEKHYEEAEAELARALDGAIEAELRPRALSRLAWCRFYAGRHAEAAETFARLLREHPRADEAEEALYMQGRCLAAAGDAKGAARALERYLREHADGAHRDPALLELAHLAGGADGRRYLERLLDGNADGELAADALFELAEGLSVEGRDEEAGERYAELLRRFPENERAPNARYGLGWSLYHAGRNAEAARVLAELGGERKAERELRSGAYELAVWAAQGAGDADAALAAWRGFEMLCEDEARRLATAKTAALALRDAKRFDDAQRLLDDLLDSVKTRQAAIEILVEGTYMALERGQVDEAEERVRIALKYGPEEAAVGEASFFVGEARYENGDPRRAVELYAAALRAEDCPVAAQALYKDGYARLGLEDVEGAAKSFRALCDGHPKSELRGEALFLLGESLYRLGRFADAADVLESVRREYPRHEVAAKALFRLGLAQGERAAAGASDAPEAPGAKRAWAAAEAALSELARRFPEFENRAEAELWRGRALAARGSGRAARQAFERVIALDQGVLSARARIQLGRLSRAAGDLEEALSQFLKVAVLYAHDEEVAEALLLAGECLEEEGDAERAAARYREVLAEHAGTRAAEPARRRLQGLGG